MAGKICFYDTPANLPCNKSMKTIEEELDHLVICSGVKSTQKL